MDVFSAFPSAVVNHWKLGSMQRATEVGDVFTVIQDLPAIEDVGQSYTRGSNGTADGIGTDTILFVRPASLPTLDSSYLMSKYMLHNTSTDKYFKIKTVGIGKNQHSGQIEHVELAVTEVEAS